MPYITRIQIEQCRNVRQLDIDLSVPASKNGASGLKFRHLILTGPNGSGKSGVLEFVANWIQEAFNSANPQHRGALTWNGIGAEPVCDAFRNGNAVSLYLPAKRTLQVSRVAGPHQLAFHPADLPPKNPTPPNFLQFLVNKKTEAAYATVDGDQAAVTRVANWFAVFEENLRRLMEDDELVVDFDRRAYNFQFRRRDGYVFDLATLAEGHAAVLGILAELLIRIDTCQHHRNDLTFEPEGVVIIDEIETHLHLSLQEKVLPFLAGIFPTLQFIVATHSPAVIASIPNAVVYDLRLREAVLSDHYRGIRYGTLMTEHFGLSSEVDLDTTDKLVRLRDLAARSPRTPEEQRQFDELSAILSARSRTLAVEVWMIKERLGEPLDAVSGARP